MDPITAATLIKTGGDIFGPILGGLFGGGGNAPEMPAWLGDMILSEYNNRSYEGFAPDKSVFTSSLNAQVGQIMTDMAIQKDAFNAEAASRGIHGSGEAMGAMYSSVVAPAVGRAAAATGQTMMQYEGLQMQGEIAAANLQGRNLDRLLSFYTTNLGAQMADYQMDRAGQQQFWQGMGSGIGSAADNITKLMMLKKFYPALFSGGAY